MLRSDLDPAPALTSARGSGVGFVVAMQPVAAHTIVNDTAGPVADEATSDSKALVATIISKVPDAQVMGDIGAGIARACANGVA